MSTSKPSSVLIIGAGAFGSSTAYHLVAQGYHNVTVLDRFGTPSKEAASTDLNKIIRYDYPSPAYSQLSSEAMEIWKSPNSIFDGLFRPSGWIIAAHDLALGFVDAVHQTARRLGKDEVRYVDANELRNKWPAFTGRFEGWTSLWSPEAGWVPSGKALMRMATAAEVEGVPYITGERGWVRELLYDEMGRCLGCLSADGSIHRAELVILCTGANTAALIDAKDEIIAESHCIGVIQLTTDEARRYQSLPIVDDFEQGILFPPDEDGRMKICSCRFITNYANSQIQGASLGHSIEDHPEDGVPRQIELEMRDFVRDMTPELADREWLSTRMCWDGDTKDVNFRICQYPNHPGLYVATAGSGHGFKFMPIIGKYVVEMLEGTLNEELAEMWSWKFGRKPHEEVPKPHPWPVRDLGDLDGWRGRNGGGAASRSTKL